MIIDSHVHLKHGDAKGTEYSAETIIKTMDAVGIDKSIVFAISTTTKHSIEMAQEAVGKFPDRLIPYVRFPAIKPQFFPKTTAKIFPKGLIVFNDTIS